MCRRAAQGCDLVDGLLHGSVGVLSLSSNTLVTGDHLAVPSLLPRAAHGIWCKPALAQGLRVKRNLLPSRWTAHDQRRGAPVGLANAACTLALLLLLLLLLMMLLLLLPLLLLLANGVRDPGPQQPVLCARPSLLRLRSLAATTSLSATPPSCALARWSRSRRRLSVRRGVCLSMNQSFIRARYIVDLEYCTVSRWGHA